MIRDLDYRADRSLAAMTTASGGGLGHLDLVHGRTLRALNHLQLRTEAVDSSKIENVDASLADYGRALLGVGANASAVAMASATAALSRMIADADATREVRLEAILRAHHELFRRHPDEAPRAGRLRVVQNWIGGSA
jgi:Fic family protein